MVLKIIYQIAIIFSLMGIGAFARFKNLFGPNTLKDIVRVNVNILLPALTFYTMITQLDKQDLINSWYLPLIGAFNILLPLLIGYIFVA